MAASVDEHLAKASEHSTSGDTDRAIESYLSAISLDPDNATAWYSVALLYMKSNSDALAIEAFEKSDEIYPNYGPTLANLAHLLWEKNPERASNYARSALIDYPENKKLRTMADFHLGSKSGVPFVESRAVERERVELSDSTEEIEQSKSDKITRANTFSSTGEHSQAVSIWKGLLEESPNSSEIWRGLGEALFSAGYSDRAKQCIIRADNIDSETKTTDTDEDSIEESIDATEALLNAAAVESNKSEIVNHVRGDLEDSIGWYNMGTNLLNEGKNDEAISSFEKAIGGCPKNEIELRIKAQNGRGNALYNSGRYPESVLAYHAAIDLDPDVVTGRTLFNMASSYAAVEMFDDAIKCFTQALDRGLNKNEVELCERQISRCRILSREQSKRQARTVR